METHTLVLLGGGFILGVVLMAGLLFSSDRQESDELESDSARWESDDIISDPAYYYMPCNIYHSDDD